MATKSQKLAEIEGYDDAFDLLTERGMDSIVPGICKNRGCDYTTDVEPDQNKGWCENCNAQTVVSINMLMGFI